MKLMEWNDSLSVGVTSIDNQHKVLIDLINELSDAMSEGKGKGVLGSIFRRLVTYTVGHFTFEEQLMDTHAYKDIFSHKEEHKKLVSQVKELQQKFESGDQSLSVETLEFLTDWLKTHILGTDKKYSSLMVSKGAK